MTVGISTLVLFDIDGTLVQTARAGIRGMNAAFSDLHACPTALDGSPVAGRTDRAIVSEAFARLSLDATHDRICALRDAYVERLAHEIAQPPAGAFGVLPGVWAVLETLARREDVCVGLLTGNFERSARVKLGHFGLWDPFALGAFGDEHLNRRDLVPIALAAARRSGIVLSADRVLVIGDTPLDVDCAHAHSARALAVATGDYQMDVLTRTGADRVVATLADLASDGEWLDDVILGR